MTCYCGAPIEPGQAVPHPIEKGTTYCSPECRTAALLAAIADHLDTFARAANDLAFLYGERA